MEGKITEDILLRVGKGVMRVPRTAERKDFDARSVGKPTADKHEPSPPSPLKKEQER